MRELATYSIETDHTVVLTFKDGRQLRASVDQLEQYLRPPDLEKVRAAIRLRQDFLRQHMPKAALALMAGGLITLFSLGGHAVAHLFLPPASPTQPSDRTGIVRSQTIETPRISTPPQPSVKDTSSKAQVASRKHLNRTLAAKPKFSPKVITKPALHLLPTPLPSTLPEIPSLPDGAIAGNTPPQNAPTPLPTPQIPNSGQVLGDSTGPGTEAPR